MKVDLSPKSSRSPAEVQALISIEIERISEPTLADVIRTFLVPPRMELRTWDWSNDYPQLPTWVVAESQRYDYGIVYSDNGFGPDNPWGLVFSSHTNFGADYCWYSSLESAFLQSRLVEETSDDRDEA